MFNPESMAQYYVDQELEEAVFDAPRLTRDSIWRCKDGRTVRVKDMLNGHLLNTINVLRGKSKLGTEFKTSDERRSEWLNVMANEAYLRGLTLEPLSDEERLANARHE